MSSVEKYRQYFTKEYLMGPNSFRLLDELIRRKPSDARFHRTLDLGCGFALTSIFSPMKQTRILCTPMICGSPRRKTI